MLWQARLSRSIQVDRTRTPREILKAAADGYYISHSTVVDAIPVGEHKKVRMLFFQLYRQVNSDKLEKEYERRGLKPADPYSLAALNEQDPSFVKYYTNGTHWRDSRNKWCHILFDSHSGFTTDGHHISTHVHVHDHNYEWHKRTWFAGLRK